MGAGAGNPNGSTGQSLPFHLAGSTAELDFIRRNIAYQTGVKPDGYPTSPP